MRRLLSNFAGGWAAFGLLLIRIVAGASLVIDGRTRLHPGELVLPLAFGVLAIVDGAFLLAGMWTPLAGFVAIALAAGEILVLHDSPGPGLFMAAVGTGLALVGPGAWSLDAHLFGLKKIYIDMLAEPSRR